MITNTRTKLAVLGAATLGLAGIADTSDAAVLIDENFQTPFVANGTAASFTGWTFQSGKYKARTTTADIPNDTDYPGVNTNQVLQMENEGWARYELAHNWSSDDVFTLTFNAAPQAWNIHQLRYARPKIYQDDGTLLWDPGETAETQLFTAPEGEYAWNGPGPYGNSDWQSEADTQFSFTINAADFTAGTEGESIYFEYVQTNFRGSYIDNINLSVDVVPEPSSLALLGLGGLMMVRRRRRDHQRQRC